MKRTIIWLLIAILLFVLWLAFAPHTLPFALLH